MEAYPSDLPAAVDAEQLKFVGKEKDRANFRLNMDAHSSQFAPGPISPTDAASSVIAIARGTGATVRAAEGSLPGPVEVRADPVDPA